MSMPPPTPPTPPAPPPSAPAAAGGLRRLLDLRMALGAVAVTVGLVIALTGAKSGGSGKDKGKGEVFLEAADAAPRAPFMPSAAVPVSVGGQLPAPPVPAPSPNGTPKVAGTTPGLYGGNQDVANCNAQQIIATLEAKPDLARVWAEPLAIAPTDIRTYITGLTPVVLRVDTRATDHELRGDKTYPAQKVLQSGTSVLVDKSGSPRVKCGSGDPLTDPRAVSGGGGGGPRYAGTPWPRFSPTTVIVIAPTAPVDTLILIDLNNGLILIRTAGGLTIIDTALPVLPTILRPGQLITVTATDFPPGTPVTVTFDAPPVTLGTFTADGAGSISATVRIPLNAVPGFRTITATGGGITRTIQGYLMPQTIRLPARR